jgi:hypothetical protein
MSKSAQQARLTVCDTVAAEHAGITPYALHQLHPADFGSPRDFRWDGQHYQYTAAGLDRLCRALVAAHQPLAAERLAQLIAREFPAPAAADETGLRLCA